MTGFPFLIAFIIAIIVMIVLISKFKIHPFLSILTVSVILGLIGGIPLIDIKKPDGTMISGIASVVGQGFSGTFTSIGIVIIFGALIGTILEKTGAAIKLSDMVIRIVGKKHPDLAIMLMGCAFPSEALPYSNPHPAIAATSPSPVPSITTFA